MAVVTEEEAWQMVALGPSSVADPKNSFSRLMMEKHKVRLVIVIFQNKFQKETKTPRMCILWLNFMYTGWTKIHSTGVTSSNPALLMTLTSECLPVPQMKYYCWLTFLSRGYLELGFFSATAFNFMEKPGPAVLLDLTRSTNSVG